MFRFLSRFLPVLVLSASTCAHAMDRPSGPVVLTVSGNISEFNAEGKAELDLAMLDALPQRRTETSTPWFEGRRAFEGPLGRALLSALGAKGTTLRVRAINDYVAEIPVEDFERHAVILASRRDGQTMGVRDKGPLFVIYPFDEEPGLYSERYFHRSVWQVKAIEVR